MIAHTLSWTHPALPLQSYRLSLVVPLLIIFVIISMPTSTLLPSRPALFLPSQYCSTFQCSRDGCWGLMGCFVVSREMVYFRCWWVVCWVGSTIEEAKLVFERAYGK